MSNLNTRKRLGALSLLLLLTACGGGGSSAPPPQSPPPTGQSPALPDPATAPALKAVFEPHFRIGAAIEPWQLDNQQDVALLLRHYNSLTAENVMKPSAIAPSAGTRNYAPADRIVDFAAANGMEVHGHTLVWHQTAPEWFLARGDGVDDAAYRQQLEDRLRSYITEVIAHFRGRVTSWDVVNEVASDNDGEVYRTSSPWYEAFSSAGGDGREYIRIAFEAARAADPQATLLINDYSTESPAKLARILEIVDYVEAAGTLVDGVGHQFHLQLPSTAASVRAALATVAARNKLNRATEIDISIYSDPGSCFSSRTGCQADYGANLANVPQSVLSQHARLYRDVFGVLRDFDATLGAVTTWGMHDGHTWLNSFPANRTNRPLLFDADRKPKLAFWAVVDPMFEIP